MPRLRSVYKTTCRSFIHRLNLFWILVFDSSSSLKRNRRLTKVFFTRQNFSIRRIITLDLSIGKIYFSKCRNYLLCALFLATHLVGRFSKTFAAYLKKKRDEGKHYFVALSHVAKKLVRVIFPLQRTGESFSDFP